MMDTSWLPVIVSGAGAIVSFVTMLSVGIIAWLVKYVLANTERRIVQLETKTENHSTQIATAAAQTVSEQEAITGMRSDIGDLRSKFETFIKEIADLMATIRLAKTPKSRGRA